MSRPQLTATYRLQMNAGFTLAMARARVDYFSRLGVSHLYLSPILAARRGSMHGYDVVDPARINPELGTEGDLRALSAGLHARGMGIVLDIVPNHMESVRRMPIGMMSSRTATVALRAMVRRRLETRTAERQGRASRARR
jgi:maltooligosyltrehalose synthase